MNDLTLPQNISANGQEPWDWAAKLSSVVQLKQERRDLTAKIRDMTTTCGSCEFWMKASCPRESRLPNSRKSGPSMSDQACVKFVITAHRHKLVEELRMRLAEIAN